MTEEQKKQYENPWFKACESISIMNHNLHARTINKLRMYNFIPVFDFRTGEFKIEKPFENGY